MIITYPNEILRRLCEPVEYGGVAATTAAERLLQAYESLPEKPLGLAAPQVGISYRVVLVRIKGRPHIYYNPRVVARGKLLAEAPEGCLSFPGLTVSVPRAAFIVLGAIDQNGKEVLQTINGQLARVFQHEIDHLNGILMIDRLPAKERKRALREWRKDRIAAAPKPELQTVKEV